MKTNKLTQSIPTIIAIALLAAIAGCDQPQQAPGADGAEAQPQAKSSIPDIDSSGWATDPRDHGMTAKEYIQAESRAFMADFIGRVGLNTFYHFPGLATAEDKWVVSPNNDTPGTSMRRLTAAPRRLSTTRILSTW